MAEIEQKALALVNEVLGEWGKDVRYSSLGRLGNSTSEALFRAIEAHEAFKQEVSDAVKIANDRVKSLAGNTAFIVNHMQCFIIPAPKPDPLVEAMADCGVDRFESWADQLRAALDARGFEIREKNDGL